MSAADHVDRLSSALLRSDEQWARAAAWGEHLAQSLPGGGRLLVAGNGGSAAQAQHLSAELVGRYLGDRRPLSAISLHTDTSAITAIVNDYGPNEMFARQIEAHGRPGDVCLLMSTSGRSPNLLHAADRARECGVAVWAMTGPGPNPLTLKADEALCIDARSTATVQEMHLVALHIICEELDECLERSVRTEQVLAQKAGAQ
jgi:D-sedoheptulose 7-phosphate isomerase